MRKLFAGALMVGALAFGAPVALAADPPAAEASPVGIGGASDHTHHVHLGNGGCVDIDAVHFEPDTRGLHQGANASLGHEAGPFHLTCH